MSQGKALDPHGAGHSIGREVDHRDGVGEVIRYVGELSLSGSKRGR